MLATNQGCFKFAFSAGRSQLQLLPERVGRCLSDRCINSLSSATRWRWSWKEGREEFYLLVAEERRHSGKGATRSVETVDEAQSQLGRREPQRRRERCWPGLLVSLHRISTVARQEGDEETRHGT
jgi:hypothetical protein